MLTDFLRVARRRWYVLLAGLLATVALVYAVPKVAPADYTARGLVLLVPSKQATGPGGNPLLVLDGLTTPAGVIVAYFQSEAAQEDVAELEPTATFDVEIEDSTRGPLISVDTTAPTADGALKTMQYVAGLIPATVSSLQQQVGASPASAIASTPLTLDRTAKKDGSAAKRLEIVAVGGGLLVTCLVTSALDGLLLRRRRDPSSQSAPVERVADEVDGLDRKRMRGRAS